MSEYAGQAVRGYRSASATHGDRPDHRAGEVLESVRILNDVERLNRVMARAGEDPEVVLEATYGWYWAVDALQAAGRPGASGASVGGQGV